MKNDALGARDANRILYDAIADNYETLDNRRNPRLEAWIKRKLAWLRVMSPGGTLLDLGAGSGFISRSAQTIFENRLACDISHKILTANRNSFDFGVAADVEALPFRSGSIDCVVAFAVLHHLNNFEGLVDEVARVIRPGGFFYSDHDIDQLFFARFRFPLSIFRQLNDRKSRYIQASPAITKEVYNASEYYQNGIPTTAIGRMLCNAGFSVTFAYHWYGLANVTNLFFGGRPTRRGFAPLANIVAMQRHKSIK